MIGGLSLKDRLREDWDKAEKSAIKARPGFGSSKRIQGNFIKFNKIEGKKGSK